MTHAPLVRPLFDGPLDLIGDVHGEIDALDTLLDRLGYDDSGAHPDGRRLVFVGDLIDKGPDSPAVLDRVRPMLEAGLAQAVMGNHELNLLQGKVRGYNAWFHGEGVKTIPARQGQKLLPPERRQEVLEFLAKLPLALERPDLRVVHASWDDASIRKLREPANVMDLFQVCDDSIDRDSAGLHDEVDRNLARQNGNPVRRITSGPEERAVTPFHAGGRLRHEARKLWWDRYEQPAFVVFGHYSRTSPQSQNGGGLKLFPADATAPVGNTMCIDLGVGARNAERGGEPAGGPAVLAAFRWPQREVVTDVPLPAAALSLPVGAGCCTGPAKRPANSMTLMGHRPAANCGFSKVRLNTSSTQQ